MCPTEIFCKYARRGAISAVYIVIRPGIINYEEKKTNKKRLLSEYFPVLYTKLSFIYTIEFCHDKSD